MTIPASNIVAVNPGVISGGGSPLAMNGVLLSQSELIPSTGLLSFVSADAVGDFFGYTSDEYAAAVIYFLGYDNSTLKPGKLWFAPYALNDRAAWLKSGSLAAMTLAQLQALSGTLTIVVDGGSVTSSAINLATATSFSDAAATISAAFSGGSPVCTWDAVQKVFYLTSDTTGAGSTIDYCTGTLSASLKLTAATAAVLSQGIDADTPLSAMTNVAHTSQNWATFTSLWEPDLAGKTAFAEWVATQNQRFVYVPWDTDGQAIVDGSTTCFGIVANTNAYDGVVPVYNTVDLAAFVLGMVASIDFTRTNARITGAFKSQTGLDATVTNESIAAILEANGYSFYGAYATANDDFTFFYNGHMSGKWEWLDPYVNQIYMNSQFQLALMTLLTTVPSVPYNEAGYSLIRAAMSDPIKAAINFGGLRTGVSLSDLQAAEVNQAAGRDVRSIIETQGFYLQVLDPGAQVRSNRGTPVINFWYTDGGAVHKISVASIDIQ